LSGYDLESLIKRAVKEKLEEVWQSGGAGREALKGTLKEEDSWRKGLLWFLGSCEEFSAVERDYYGRYTRGPAPRLIRDPFYAEKLPNGNYLVTDYGGHQVIEVTPDYEIVWEYGDFFQWGTELTRLHHPWRAVYNERLNTVLIADTRNNRVLEVDYATKNILHVLTSSALGPFGQIGCAEYGRTGILIADVDNHYVAEVDWNGNVLWSFGVYGVPGNDLTHLSSPRSIDFTWNRYVIADFDNDRVLMVGSDGTVSEMIPIGWPHHVKVDEWVPIIGLGSWFDVGILMERYGAEVFYIPHRTNMMTLTKDWSVLTAWDMSAYEYDIRAFKPYIRPLTGIREYSLDIDEESKIVPFLTLGTSKVSVQVYSSQDATLRVYGPNIPVDTINPLFTVDPTTPWRLLDTLPIGADTTEVYTPAFASPILGFSVLMGGVAGNVKMIFHKETV